MDTSEAEEPTLPLSAEDTDVSAPVDLEYEESQEEEETDVESVELLADKSAEETEEEEDDCESEPVATSKKESVEMSAEDTDVSAPVDLEYEESQEEEETDVESVELLADKSAEETEEEEDDCESESVASSKTESVEQSIDATEETIIPVLEKEPISVNDEDRDVDPDHVAAISTEMSYKPCEKKQTTPRSRLPPPSPAFRFLLNQGVVGHFLAMSAVLTIEWIETYLPALARFLAWLWRKMAPTRLQHAQAPLPRRPRRPGPPTVAINPRAARSSKLRKKLTQQADQQALERLKRVGNVGEAKYRHVSTDFLQRHHLGSFADMAALESGMETHLSSSISKEKEDGKEEAVDDDVDWIVEALGKEKRNTRNSSVSVEVGPKGPSMSVGVEFGFGSDQDSRDRRTSLMRAATSSAILKKRKVHRASDREGGSGVVGRLRAAAGANSRVSRSLFGAYPGDAVPVKDAANTKGVIELARKYGYGDWSEDEEDDDDEQGGVAEKPRRVKSKRRKKPHYHSNLTEDAGWHSSGDTSTTDWQPPIISGRRTNRKHSRQGGHSDPKNGLSNNSVDRPVRSRRTRSNPPLSSSSILGKKRDTSTYGKDRLEKVQPVRPAMERVWEVRRKAQTYTKKED